jgi:chromosome segregation ATPase
MSEVQERLAANVVTSENLAEFTAQKLGLVDNDPAPVAESEDANSAASEPEGQDDQSGQEGEDNDATATEEQKERKPNPKLERRFSEITKQREAAREEARREREARESLEARLKELEARVNPPAQQPDDALGEEPQPEQFSDMYEYAKALAEYTADKKLMERDNEEKARKAAAEQEAKFKTWADRVNAAKNELPDFEDMVQSSDVRVSDPVRDAIIESENGPQILYYLAENAEFAKKLADMSVVSAVREIGKIEARFEKAKASEPQVKPVVGKSKAPAPISPLRGAVSTVDAGLDADGNFHGTYQQWKAARQARKIR